MKPIELWMGILISASVTQAQADVTSRPTTDTLEDAARNLQAALDRAVADDAPHDRRRDLLESFLRDYAASDPNAAAVLAARCRLGNVLLTAFEPTAAKQQFEVVAEFSRQDARDLRGRALYGIAQSCELVGDLAATRKALQRTITEFRGTRYARYAEVALQRIANPSAVAIGSRAPEFGPRLDLQGKSRQVADLAHEPAWIAFLSLADADGLRTFRAAHSAVVKAGVEPEQIIVFAMHGDAAELAAAVAREGWRMPIILCDREFLDSAVLAYRIQHVPSTFLLGPDGTLLARNATPRRLTEAIGALRK